MSADPVSYKRPALLGALVAVGVALTGAGKREAAQRAPPKMCRILHTFYTQAFYTILCNKLLPHVLHLHALLPGLEAVVVLRALRGLVALAVLGVAKLHVRSVCILLQ